MRLSAVHALKRKMTSISWAGLGWPRRKPTKEEDAGNRAGVCVCVMGSMKYVKESK